MKTEADTKVVGGECQGLKAEPPAGSWVLPSSLAKVSYLTVNFTCNFAREHSEYVEVSQPATLPETDEGSIPLILSLDRPVYENTSTDNSLSHLLTAAESSQAVSTPRTSSSGGLA